MSPSRLLAVALPLTFVVVVAGAYVRLSDAGLGCPDWPGCYGQLVGVADARTAAERYPTSVYDAHKAWIEVGHRYIAGLLGILLLLAALLDWRKHRRFGLPQGLLLLVIGQALLGMLTVTEKLRPIIVIAHLLGGLFILALLAAATVRKPLSVSLDDGARRVLRRWWRPAFFALLAQIILGGWVSANYAGLSCPDFPLCQGGWLPPVLDFSGYQLWRDLHQTSAGEPINAAALSTIHWLHRVGAVFVLILFAVFIVRLRKKGAKREGAGLSVFLVGQIILGALNVVWQLPLWAAVAHNAVAAILIVNMAVIRVKLSP